MKIELNATRIGPRPSGAKQRFVGIYTELFARLPNDEFVIYEPADCRTEDWFPRSSNVRYCKTPILSESRVQKFFADLSFLHSRKEAHNCNIFEWFNFPAFRMAADRSIITIHDVRRLVFNNNVIAKNISKYIVDFSLDAVDEVVTVSEAVRDEILHLYPKTRVSVIYNGIDLGIYESITADDCEAVRQKLNIPSEFILAVGHLEKRKNYANLIDALALLHSSGKAIPLLIVGNDSGERSSIAKRIHRLGLSRYVMLLCGLSDIEIRCLYKLCALFVYPSAYEGFGIPILEAMAAKRPMVLSNIPVFREITQDVGCYFRHEFPESIAGEIFNGLSSTSLRETLINYGNKRVHDFGFENIALAYERLYKDSA